jgi:hypothetical protein
MQQRREWKLAWKAKLNEWAAFVSLLKLFFFLGTVEDGMRS